MRKSRFPLFQALFFAAVFPLASMAFAVVWEPARTVAGTVAPVSQLHVARGAGGREAASWIEAGRLVVSVRDGVADWPAATPFPAPETGAVLNNIDVLVDGNGDVTVAWLEGSASDRRLRVRALRAGVWQTPATLSTGATSAAAMASDASGNATVAWLQAGAVAGSCDVRAADAQAGGDFSAASVLSHDCRNEIDLAVNARGDALVAWSNRLVIYGGSPVIAAQRSAGGNWSLPVIVAGPTYRSHSARVALADNGKAVALWADAYGPQYARRNAAGVWSNAASVDTSGAMSYTGLSDVVIDGQGNATAILGVWDMSYSAQGLVARKLGASAFSWSAPVRITAAGATIDSFSVTATQAGNLAVGWLDSTANNAGLARGVGVSVREAGNWTRKSFVKGPREIAVGAGGGSVAVLWATGSSAARLQASEAALP